MKLFLADGSPIGGSDLLSAIYRTDLVPVPVSLELVVKNTDALKNGLITGETLTTATGVPLTIVKSQVINTQSIKDGKRIGAIHVIAVLSGCEPLLGVASRATSLTNTSFNEIYRSLGAKVRLANDIKLAEFICLKGQLPTKRIALALQKEGAVMRYDMTSNKMTVTRIGDLFAGDGKLMDKSAVQLIEHPTTAKHDNTNYLSIDDNGSDIVGEANSGRHIGYYPRADARELNNLKRILMVKATLLRPFDESLNAGTLLTVGNEKYTILTSAHRFETGAMGGQAVMATRAWLAQIESSKGAL